MDVRERVDLLGASLLHDFKVLRLKIPHISILAISDDRIELNNFQADANNGDQPDVFPNLLG
jgi:hypothetical protein